MDPKVRDSVTQASWGSALEVGGPEQRDNGPGGSHGCHVPTGSLEDPHKLFHCSHGAACEKVCPANLHFNPDLLVCDWPEEAGNPAARSSESAAA
ncbi:carbohydrate-binding module family 14 protein [Streptomyces xanthophaeus]